MHELKDNNENSLMDYITVLVKHKKSIILITLLPSIFAALIISFIPSKYKLTYCYSQGEHDSDIFSGDDYIKDNRYFDLKKYFMNKRENTKDQYYVSNWDLTQKNYKIFLSWYYSSPNISHIIDVLKKNEFNEYAQKIKTADRQSKNAIENMISFSVFPQFPDISKINQKDPEKLKGLIKIQAELLCMNIYSEDKDSLYDVAAVVRHNFEHIIPLCMVKQSIKTNTRNFRTKITEIEKDRFQLNLQMDLEREKLKKLRKLNKNQTDKTVLDIIELEKKLSCLNRNYQYLKSLIDLNKKLLKKLKANLFSEYTIQDFRNELNEMACAYDQKDIKNYLVNLIGTIDNRISLNTPVTEKPEVTKLSTSIVKKVIAVFFMTLIISFLFAFYSEHVRRSSCKKQSR